MSERQRAAGAGADGEVVAVVRDDVGTTRGLLACLAEQLRFPKYFGHNWDALDECLQDLSWLGECSAVIRHEGIPGIPGDELLAYLSVLADAREKWETSGGHRLAVLFSTADWPVVERLTRGRLHR